MQKKSPAFSGNQSIEINYISYFFAPLGFRKKDVYQGQGSCMWVWKYYSYCCQQCWCYCCCHYYYYSDFSLKVNPPSSYLDDQATFGRHSTSQKSLPPLYIQNKFHEKYLRNICLHYNYISISAAPSYLQMSLFIKSFIIKQTEISFYRMQIQG